ncbi:MAG: RNA methyltransferase, partial [Tidjanibacter sp.]|nr:RNA methyltransferase [Tidjanibacter sp.]
MTKADIQLVRSLADKQARTTYQLFVAEGDKVVGEIVASKGWRISRLFVLEDSAVKAPYAELVSPKEMERMSSFKSIPRSLAVVEMPNRKLLPAVADELVIALDEVQDPGNLGTIIRTADWFGIRRIVCTPTTADCWGPKVVQATMGALLRVEVCYGDLAEWLADARKRGVATYATTLDGENIYHKSLSRGGVIVMGNEGRGVSAEVQRLVSDHLYIPPYPADRCGSESLNVAIATAITCAEFR